MAGDTIDGCVSSKMSTPEEMELGPGEFNDGSQLASQQDANSQVNPMNVSSQEASSQLTMTQDQSQPNTQPLDKLDMESVSQALEEGVWGQLYPHCGAFPRIPLSKDVFRFGRASSCDYVIREEDMGDKKWVTAVSKIQCEIFRDKKGVFVKDLSSNGTWVNGHKIGKGLQFPLEHNAEICFAGQFKKVFVFMSNEGQTETFPSELTSSYTVSKMLGRGACGEVRLGFRIPDLKRVAIKIINKRTCSTISSMSNSNEEVMNEVRILQSVSHPNIINLEDVIDTKDFLYIILELAEGGELFDKIIDKSRLNETEAKLYFYQMASAISYLHSKNICHRDLKPENILLCSQDDQNPVIKITDMGLSKLVDLGSILKTMCGTPQYIAPEIIKGQEKEAYSLKVDCWSLGVILYIIVSGTPPFTEDRKCGMNLRDQILKGNYHYYPSLFDRLSKECKNLIDRCLKVDPSERISAIEILEHPWLQDKSIVKRAKDLMSSQLRGKKRLIEEVDSEGSFGPLADKKMFKSPRLV